MLSCDQGMACLLFWIFKLEKFEFKREKSNNQFGWAFFLVEEAQTLRRTSNVNKTAKFSEEMFGNSVCWKMVLRIHHEHILHKAMVPNVHHRFLQGVWKIKRTMSYWNF